MAKKALLDVLEQTIGKYVLNLDAESLNVALWSGKIELKALQLDCHAVNAELARQAADAPNLAIPFKVVSGEFEHFEVDVPWTQLMSRPVILSASGLKVVVEPYDHTSSSDFLNAIYESEAVRAQKIEEHRAKSLEYAEENRKRANTLRDMTAQDFESRLNQSAKSNERSTFASRLVRRIIENIQVEITDVKVVVQGSGCSAGVTLDSLSVVTTDKDGKRTFMDRTAGTTDSIDQSFLFKVLQITGLGIYFDEDENKLTRLSSISENPIEEDCDHLYVLAPLSFEAKLRQADSNNCVDYPKYLLASELTFLSVILSKTQVDLASKIAEQIQPAINVAKPLFPEYRPLKRVTKDTAVDWWKYAARCVGRLNGRRSWTEFIIAFRSRKEYIPLYKRHVHSKTCPWMQPLSDKELAQLQAIEKTRSISLEGIMTWRNISDAQAKKEGEKRDVAQAKSKGNIFSSLFGGPKVEGTGDEEGSRVSLTVEELQELEKFTTSDAIGSDLSSDSRLCDVKFVLGSFQINLSSYDQRPLTSLEMGAVSASFDANQDGSYGLDLALTSLEVHDRVTPKSLFPTILKNQPGLADEGDKVLSVRCGKSKSGDQHVEVKLNTFEAVASPNLLMELKQFFSVSKHRPVPTKSAQKNPVLAQSLSGSIDLFYDATEGSDRKDDPALVVYETQELPPSAGRDDISNALIDAWRIKTETKSSWVVDLDIQAPIVVVPENCTSPRANVLVFDLGHLRFQYGKVDNASPKVDDWFQQAGSPVVPVLDNGSIRISSLTFTIGKANYWRRIVRKHESSEACTDDEAIIDPISLSVDFGVESVIDQIPRLCAIGVLPAISLHLSPSQLSRILHVSNAWQKRLKEVFPDNEPPDIVDCDVPLSLSSCCSPLQAIQSTDAPLPIETLSTLASETQMKALSVLYAEVRLQKLSIKVLDDGENGIEAHLISVTASTSRLADGSSSSSLSMGWFWILDRFANDFPRRQRLIAHSTLPVPPEKLAEEEKYDILGELNVLGVFDDAFEVSTDLADINFRQSAPGSHFERVNPFAEEERFGAELAVSSILDANFTSLFITWNPRAVKTMASMVGTFAESLRSYTDSEMEEMVISSPAQLTRRRRLSSSSLRSKTDAKTAEAGTMWIKAAMDGLQISLNSARDDLPLFTGAMASTQLSVVFSGNDYTRLALEVGELKVTSPAMGRTDRMYRTILGLVVGKSDSLLSVRYYAGSKSLADMSSKGTDLSDCEAYCEVELSPMRMVYIQAQVLALVEYATAGILGAMAAQAASSAGNAAAELASSSELKKIFVVRASGFELCLPQAAYKTKYISAHLGSLLVDFSTLPDSSAEAQISLCNVSIQDTSSDPLLQEPVRMDVHVSLKPEGVGTKDDQAIDVNIAISEANFVLAKPQYAQLLATLDENVGEEDLFLRENSVPLMHIAEVDSETEGPPLFTGMTHAGVENVNDARRLYLNVTISALGLSLFGADQDDPLLRMSALDAVVNFKSLSDCGKMTAQVTLRDLACDDQRFKSAGRQYRSLIYQPKPEAAENREYGHDIFFASYETCSSDQASSIELKVGSPIIVFIPDVVSDVLEYIKVERKPHQNEVSTVSDIVNYHEVVSVEAAGEAGIEASFVHQPEQSLVSSLSVTMKTSRCSVLLVDLGSDTLRQRSSSSMTLTVASVAEIIVLGGVFEANITMQTEAASNNVISIDAEFHGDGIEACTAFGRDLRSSVQVLDPTQFSLYVNSKSVSGLSNVVDVRCAVLSPVDVVLSMRNVALMNAVMTSLSDCFEDRDRDDDSKWNALSEEEAKQIEHLARALETDDSDLSNHSRDVQLSADAALAPSKPGNETTIQNESSIKLTTLDIKLTLVNDLQGLDEAILRLTVRNVVANGRLQADVRNNKDSPPFTACDFNFHTSILADYFDASTSMWKVLLLNPWEISAKGNRGCSRGFLSNRPSTTVDVDSFPCHLSFSEQFLMSVASANRMWSVYTAASSSALESLQQSSQVSKSLRRSVAASAARTFISSLPYALENHAGISIELVINGEKRERRTCNSGSIEYFRFEPPTGNGSGGKRLYGQDVSYDKSVSLVIGDRCVDLPHLDSQVGNPKMSHAMGNHRVVMTDVVKEGKTIVLHVSSGIDVQNRSSIPFTVSIFKDGVAHEVGTCSAMSFQSGSGQHEAKSSLVVQDGRVSKPSSRFGIPVTLIDAFRADWAEKAEAMVALSFSPMIDCPHPGWYFSGGMKLRMNESVFSGSSSCRRFEITCRPISHNFSSKESAPRDLHSFVMRACVSMTLVEGKDPTIEISIEPRAVIINKIPISITVKSPMPHIFSGSPRAFLHGEETTHDIGHNAQIEIFTPGPSVAVSVKCTDPPIGGTATDWLDGGWIDLPLAAEFRMQEPLECMFPFVKNTIDPLSLTGARGSDFVIAEGSINLANLSLKNKAGNHVSGSNSSEKTAVELAAPPSAEEDWSTFFVTVCNYGVDHTGEILFEQLIASDKAALHRSSTGGDTVKTPRSTTQISPAIGAFATGRHRGRISLLPGLSTPIRLLHLSMEADEGLRRSSPFHIEDISICEGGMDATPVKWADNTLSGFFAYRKLVSSYQSEIHIVPEYVVFNGSAKHRVYVRQPGGIGMMVGPGKLASLRVQGYETAIIVVEYPDLGAQTNPLRIDSLGMRMAIVMSKSGFSMASFALQTVVGALDSRLVVKLGDIKYGSMRKPNENASSPYKVLQDDFLRFRVKWSELQMTLNEARPITEGNYAILESALDRIKNVSTSAHSERSAFLRGKSSSTSETWVEARQRNNEDRREKRQQGTDDAVCTILFTRFTVDWQRVFKEGDSTQLKSAREALESSERSQFSVVIHSIRIRDETPETPYPIVFDSTSQNVNFFDLCIRFRGESTSDIVKIDLLDLNLAHVNGISENIYLNTNEDFVWKVLDLADRIVDAAAEFAGVAIQLNWDDEHDGYVVAVREKISSYMEEETKYTPPKSDTIYHIKKTRVSPFKIIVSFKRNPQSSRYKLLQGFKGAHLMNYFTRQLKFKIEKAELNFARYEVSDVKGPPDRFVELLSTVYASRMKKKAVTIMTAASFQDWKFLASREGGDDAYEEGDIMRVTGNAAGSTADYVLQRAGRGIGSGLSNVANTIGGGIESATDAMGVRAIGAGVNSVVSGVGDGVGDTISGVGSGAGKVLKSVGQGAGQVFGGLTGGALIMGKGVGKGIATGDGRALASGLVQGGAAVGTGVGQGLESVVTGTAEGVLHVGQGLFSGVRSIGRGFGDAFVGCCSCFSCCTEREEANLSGVYSPLLQKEDKAEECPNEQVS